MYLKIFEVYKCCKCKCNTYRGLCPVMSISDQQVSLQLFTFTLSVLHFRLRHTPLTTRNMAASSDRSPPPFPAAEEPGAGPCDMADGDSDEGEDIFVSTVGFQLGLMVYTRCEEGLCAWSDRASLCEVTWFHHTEDTHVVSFILKLTNWFIKLA